MTSQPGSNPAPLPAPQPLRPDVQAAATTSLILEAIFGLSGLLGIGHVYSGRTAVGIGLMLFWWLYIAVAAVGTSFTGGLGGCLFVPIYVALPILSGVNASAFIRKTNGTGSWQRVFVVGGVGCLVLIGSICLLTTFGVISLGVLSSMFQSQ